MPPMSRIRTPHFYKMPFLKPWRRSLGLSRAQVVARLAELPEMSKDIDQATLAKWESGESAVRVEDLELLAKAYGVPAQSLFYPPGDQETPELLARAHEIITGRNREAVKAWLESARWLPAPEKTEND